MQRIRYLLFLGRNEIKVRWKVEMFNRMLTGLTQRAILGPVWGSGTP